MSHTTGLRYLHGFGNEHETEALAGALPSGQFNPQRATYGLYTEQFSSTAFTAPRSRNRRTWFYRIRPSVTQGDYTPLENRRVLTAPLHNAAALPDLMRWDPLPLPQSRTDFIDGLITFAVNGDAALQAGAGIHLYAINAAMENRFFYCADGELLIVPQSGGLRLRSECGALAVEPGEIVVIPRGMKFALSPSSESARGYVCENYGQPLELPERGPVGANGLANDRDFQYPVAAYEDVVGEFELVAKFSGRFYRCTLEHSPLDVVAWTGNSAPYKYDLSRYNVINTVSFDHPDPSIFTVLTSASNTPGVANLDFVIFPPRWMVAEHTLRPPWYHRNVMSEFMGLIKGVYDAKESGFLPGGASLHNCMSPHGPEAAVFEKASAVTLKPERYRETLAFMFESRYAMTATPHALATRQSDYLDCWRGIQSHFDPVRQ